MDRVEAPSNPLAPNSTRADSSSCWRRSSGVRRGRPMTKMLSFDNMTSTLLPFAAEPFTPPTDRDMLPSERREFVRTHRTCVFGTARRADGPAMSIVYYVPTDTDELLVSTMRDRSKARSVARHPKVSLCVLDERWPFSYLQVYCDAAVDDDPDLVVDVMMAVGGRMSGQPLADD